MYIVSIVAIAVIALVYVAAVWATKEYSCAGPDYGVALLLTIVPGVVITTVVLSIMVGFSPMGQDLLDSYQLINFRDITDSTTKSSWIFVVVAGGGKTQTKHSYNYAFHYMDEKGIIRYKEVPVNSALLSYSNEPKINVYGNKNRWSPGNIKSRKVIYVPEGTLQKSYKVQGRQGIRK